MGLVTLKSTKAPQKAAERLARLLQEGKDTQARALAGKQRLWARHTPEGSIQVGRHGQTDILAELPPPVQDKTDAEVIALWLTDKSPQTQTAYASDVRRFRSYVPKPLSKINSKDLSSYLGSLQSLAPSTQARMIASLKSLYRFAHESSGHLSSNPLASFPTPKKPKPRPVKKAAQQTTGEVLPRGNLTGSNQHTKKEENAKLAFSSIGALKAKRNQSIIPT